MVNLKQVVSQDPERKSAGPAARRPYRSTLREAQSAASRAAVVTAATALFLRQGYVRTTMDAVATAAGVSRKTVFDAAGGKGALLKLAWDRVLVGDDEPVPMADREAVLAIRAETDPRAALRLWVTLQVDVAAHAGPLGRVVVEAAPVDPDAAELLATIQRERWAGARAFAAHLQQLDALRPGLTVERAADLCWLHTDPVVHERLVVDRGWSPTELQQWLLTSVSAGLGVGAPAPGTPGRARQR